jgi:WD40 repeat protein
MYLMKDGWMQHPFYSYSLEQDKPFYHSNTRTLVHRSGDPFRLLSFLTRCEKMLNILIKDSDTRNQKNPNFPDSARTRSARRVMKLPAGSEKFCAQFHKLIGISTLKKFPLSIIRAESSSQLLISVQVNPETDESFLLIWPGSRACRPDHVLHTRSRVTCCYWTGDDRVVAGTSEGSLLLWDWQEGRSGSGIDVESGHFVPREPAFASSCVTSLDVHQSSIVSIDGMGRESGNPDQGCRRIVVVDEQALISFWMVEVVVVNQSEMGEGMFPGSKCKLLLEARTGIDALSRVTFLCSAQDEAAGCFFVGTETGVIHEFSQFTGSAITYTQIRDDADESTLSSVSCLSLNPVQRNLFVASFADGTISLFRRSGSSPGTHLMTWDATDTQICTAITVHWLPSSASAFVALSASSSLVAWDLDICLWNPLFKYQLTKYVYCCS